MKYKPSALNHKYHYASLPLSCLSDGRSLLDITGEEDEGGGDTASVFETEELRAASFSCFTEMPERWGEVTDTRSGVAKADKEFMERYVYTPIRLFFRKT